MFFTLNQQESKFLKFLGFMWNPLSWVMEAAALMAIDLANGDHRPPKFICFGKWPSSWNPFLKFWVPCFNERIRMLVKGSEGASDVGVLAAGRWFDHDPEARDCDGNKAGPNVDAGGSSSSSSHKPFCKRVKMSQHAEAEEHVQGDCSIVGWCCRWFG